MGKIIEADKLFEPLGSFVKKLTMEFIIVGAILVTIILMIRFIIKKVFN
ncbi:hypothetical protein [Algoriphagus sanaruensis]|uniref:Uncharacterized protein n=1 Tax=Algoriphagus sanaruensis TaxID=1727163 RepID=A0A142EMX2_9BACT|nr:hypothetical protein [Algoriphagus sanaruensis]AMQ56477.1 hypothetical protein AO498_08617 [Algoriphagus sanaruensis]